MCGEKIIQFTLAHEKALYFALTRSATDFSGRLVMSHEEDPVSGDGGWPVEQAQGEEGEEERPVDDGEQGRVGLGPHLSGGNQDSRQVCT